VIVTGGNFASFVLPHSRISSQAPELSSVVDALQAVLDVPGHDGATSDALARHCELFRAASSAQAHKLDALESRAKSAEAKCQAELSTLSVYLTREC
jgi:hypothetical protein